MKPEADQVLNMSAMQLLTQILPQLPPGYPQGTTSLIAVLSLMAAQEYERAADIRAAENNDLRILFRELARTVEDASLRGQLENAAASDEESFAISSLDAANYELRRTLIELQTHVEGLPGSAARAAEQRIWTVLKASAGRRLVRLPSI